MLYSCDAGTIRQESYIYARRLYTSIRLYPCRHLVFDREGLLQNSKSQISRHEDKECTGGRVFNSYGQFQIGGHLTNFKETSSSFPYCLQLIQYLFYF